MERMIGRKDLVEDRAAALDRLLRLARATELHQDSADVERDARGLAVLRAERVLEDGERAAQDRERLLALTEAVETDREVRERVSRRGMVRRMRGLRDRDGAPAPSPIPGAPRSRTRGST